MLAIHPVTRRHLMLANCRILSLRFKSSIPQSPSDAIKKIISNLPSNPFFKKKCLKIGIDANLYRITSLSFQQEIKKKTNLARKGTQNHGKLTNLAQKATQSPGQALAQDLFLPGTEIPLNLPNNHLKNFILKMLIQHAKIFSSSAQGKFIKPYLDSGKFYGLMEKADLSLPREWYPMAREMKRKIILHVGPTNSGTYLIIVRLTILDTLGITDYIITFIPRHILLYQTYSKERLFTPSRNSNSHPIPSFVDHFVSLPTKFMKSVMGWMWHVTL